MRLPRPALALCALFALALAARVAQAQVRDEAIKAVFFDPGANQFDVVGLANALNSYLGRVDGQIEFQIVQDPRALENLLKDPHVQYAWVASDYVRKHKDGPLKPLLVPASRGEVYFRKVLIDNGGKELQAIRSVAATGSEAAHDRDRILQELALMGIKAARVVLVPKDIDAELALSFGQVDAALVTPVSIEVLRKVNPQGTAKFRKLADTQRILRSPFCSVEGRPSDGQANKLQSALLNMGDMAEGQELMRRLSFDGWQKYEGGMLK